MTLGGQVQGTLGEQPTVDLLGTGADLEVSWAPPPPQCTPAEQ